MKIVKQTDVDIEINIVIDRKSQRARQANIDGK